MHENWRVETQEAVKTRPRTEGIKTHRAEIGSTRDAVTHRARCLRSDGDAEINETHSSGTTRSYDAHAGVPIEENGAITGLIRVPTAEMYL